MKIGQMMIGGLAAAAAGTAAVMNMPGDGGPDETTIQNNLAADNYEICLKRPLPLFEGVESQCYDRRAFRNLYNARVVDASAEAVGVSMSHPNDYSAPDAVASTCGEYREMQFDGWYAASAREMRREAFMMRACAVLAVLADAAPATSAYFSDGSPTADELAAFIEAGGAAMGEAPEASAIIRVVSEEQYFWRVETETVDITIEELANADFDADGIEEILVFVTTAAQDGTMSVPTSALLNKDGRGAALTLAPIRSERETDLGKI